MANDSCRQGTCEFGEKAQQVLQTALQRVKELIAEGNARRLTLRTPDERVHVQLPLTAGVVIGSVLVLFAPFWAVLAAAAAALARVRVQVSPREEKREG